MVVTSSNHFEILAIHETSRECIWLSSIIQHVWESCGLSSRQYCLKIMLLVLHKLHEATSKVTGSNTYHRSSSTHMSSIREAIMIFNKYGQVTIWQIYSQKHFRYQHSRSWYIKLECASSKMLHTEKGIYLIKRSIFFRKRLCLCIVLFFLSHDFFHWIS